MQTSFYFSYMAVASYAVFLMLGCVGVYSALFFVRYIYGSIKVAARAPTARSPHCAGGVCVFGLEWMACTTGRMRIVLECRALGACWSDARIGTVRNGLAAAGGLEL